MGRRTFVTLTCPLQNGLAERLIRTLNEQCVHRQRCDSIRHATRDIGDRITFDNNHRPHQDIAMRKPAEAFNRNRPIATAEVGP